MRYHLESSVSPATEEHDLAHDGGVSLDDTTFTVLDIETTGGSATQNRITEIAAIKIKGKQECETFHTLVNPCHPIPLFITKLTGISDAMVRCAPTIDLVIPQFLEFIADTVPVAHNATFDLGFLRRASESANLNWTGKQHICTLKLARTVIPKTLVNSFKLSDLSAYFCIENLPSHRALADVKATIDIFHKMLAIIDPKVHTLDQLHELQN